jgi:peptidoglycan/xylan/chitin deacetylase (PgdA/CDA1 family)
MSRLVQHCHPLVVLRCKFHVSDDVEACVDDKTYALTFSGGPTNATLALLDILAQQSVPASFFVVGQTLAQFSTVFKAEGARGHSQFSDGYSRVSLSSLTAEDCFWELQKVRSAFLELGCVNPALFRAPYHDLSPAHRDLTNRMGLRNVYYNLDTQDWLYAANDSQQVLVRQATAANATFPGSIIHLQQDVDARSVALVPQMITNAISIGYTFVTMEQCLWGNLYQLHPSWYVCTCALIV